MKQTGLIIKAPSPSDYVMGGVTAIQAGVLNPSGNWKAWLPSNERQAAKDFSFDTLSCTTFSAMNFMETLLDYLIANSKVSANFLKFLNDDGYMDDNGKVNFSDRWIAIKSGTTIKGNDFISVWNAIRKYGLIPEKMFPFGGNSFEEYHDRANLTKEMEAQGQKWMALAEVMYEWVFFSWDTTNLDLSAGEKELMATALKASPVHMGSPKPATHAVMAYGMGVNSPLVFDSYDPFDTEDKTYTRVNFGIKGAFSEKVAGPRTLKRGSKGDDVVQLQKDLNFLMSAGLKEDGDYGTRTFTWVVKFQQKYGLDADGIYGKMSRAKMAEKIEEKKTLHDEWGLLPLVSRKAQQLVDECGKAGMSIRITSGFRSFEKQQELYDQGRTKPGTIVTNAKPGYSFHNYGVAFDVYSIKGESLYGAIADIAKRIGLQWGGDFQSFKDMPHFEDKQGYTISDFLNKRVDFKKYD